MNANTKLEHVKHTRKEETKPCPICQEKIPSNENEFYHHVAMEHEDFTKKVISLYDSIDDFGYFMSCLKCELESINTDRWWRS